MKFYTIGYGGRPPRDFVESLQRQGVQAIVDVRLRPDRASMGSYSLARSPEKGIERLLAEAGIAYHHRLELGNLFLGLEWRQPYQELLDRAGHLLVARLDDLPEPFCLLCAEKRVADCHRRLIAEYLVRVKGWEVEHLE